MLRFTDDHEWLKLDGDIATVGITEHAATQMGDVVFVELPEIGAKVAKEDSIAVVESVKAASDIFAPLDGEIVEVNEAIVSDPAMVNQKPMGDAWFFKMKLTDPSTFESLLDEDAYKALIAA